MNLVSLIKKATIFFYKRNKDCPHIVPTAHASPWTIGVGVHDLEGGPSGEERI